MRTAAGRRLPLPLAARQDRALHPRRELHRLLLLEDLRQGRHRHLGDAADRLSAHAARPAEPRAARLRARRQLFLVPLLSANRVKYPLIRRRLLKLWREARAFRTIRSRPGRRSSRTQESRELHQQARPRRLRARKLARGQRDHRRRQHLHHQELGPGPRHRLLADPGDVDGLLRRRQRAICR